MPRCAVSKGNDTFATSSFSTEIIPCAIAVLQEFLLPTIQDCYQEDRYLYHDSPQSLWLHATLLLAMKILHHVTLPQAYFEQ